LPAHTHLKLRRQGQTSAEEVEERDLRAELLRAEAEHRKKIGKAPLGNEEHEAETEEHAEKRLLESGPGEDDEATVKRRKILEQARELDAESEEDESDERFLSMITGLTIVIPQTKRTRMILPHCTQN
jgi:protein CWC15